VNEGVNVEIFHNGHGRHLFFVLVLFLDHVFSGLRALCTSPVRRVATVSGLHLCGVPGSPFREHLSILAGRVQLCASFSDLKRTCSPVSSPRAAPVFFSLPT